MQSKFWAGTKYLEQHKTFFGPVKGQGNNHYVLEQKLKEKEKSAVAI